MLSDIPSDLSCLTEAQRVWNEFLILLRQNVSNRHHHVLNTKNYVYFCMDVDSVSEEAIAQIKQHLTTQQHHGYKIRIDMSVPKYINTKPHLQLVCQTQL